ncbi:MAG: D-alanine--D-alanine ligase [Gemmatimonadaceae bacterium]|nr:D-alanine--D-alanine ligase [Gemmatimonadaceae bacterium]
MTRIGFAYNRKPDQAALRLEDDEARPDEEPPSTSRDDQSRFVTARADLGAGTPLSTPHPHATPDDEFAEWDSEETIAAVEHALRGLGQVIRLEANAEFPERLRAARPDIVFNMAEGLRGPNREAHVPAICEFFGIPYSGSDPFTLALCLDKARTKEVLAYHGVPTAPFCVIRSPGELDRLITDAQRNAGSPERRVPALPVFIKPVHEGSSKGITERNYCRTWEELREQGAFLLARYAQPVLVEEYLPGAEFTCAVLGNGDAARVLPIVGMRFDALPAGVLPVYGFEAKWLWDTADRPLEIFDCPARIDEALRRRIEEVVLAAYRVLACRDWSRIDVRLDAAGVPNVVEVNPLPGILPNPADNSCLPKAARAAGMSYDELIQACLRDAAERQGVPLSGQAVRRTRRAAAMG